MKDLNDDEVWNRHTLLCSLKALIGQLINNNYSREQVVDSSLRCCVLRVKEALRCKSADQEVPMVDISEVLEMYYLEKASKLKQRVL